MNCRGCGNEKAYRMISTVNHDVCDRCMTGSHDSGTVHDVYWPGRPHYNDQLVDKFGKPILLTSRGHKAQVLKEKGLIEAGDRHHGAPIGGGLGNMRLGDKK